MSIDRFAGRAASTLTSVRVESLESRYLMAAGVPDTLFDGDGYKPINIGIADGVHAAGAGKTVVVGGENTGITVLRINRDGSPDSSFDGDGKATLSKLNATEGSLVQADGKVVAAGYDPVDEQEYLVRFNANGSLDTTFGSSGIAATGLGYGAVIQLLQLPGGQILALGYQQLWRSDKADLSVARYNANGQLDASFGSGGVRSGILNIGGRWVNPENAYASWSSFGVLPDGRIVVSTNGGGLFGGTMALFFRLNANGSTDTTFNYNNFTGSQYFDPTTGYDDRVYQMSVLPDASVVAVGRTTSSSWNVWKFRPATGSSMSLDPTFDGDGTVSGTFEGNIGLAHVSARPDGNIVVASNGVLTGQTQRALLVARYRPDGSLDPAFGPGGGGTWSGTFGGTHTLSAMSVANDDGSIAMLALNSAAFDTNTPPYALAKLKGDIDPPEPPATASISGTLWNDADADGVKDSGEVGLSGWRVYVDADNDGTFDSTEKSALTSSSGAYAITGLAAGSHRVRQVLFGGWRKTSPSGSYHTVTLTSGQSSTGKNFGNTQKVRISGTLWNDTDGDGSKDSGEVGLSGWKVYLDTDKDGVHDSTERSYTTGTSGSYAFDNLAAGTYRVRTVLPGGWRRTSPTSSYVDKTLGNGATTTQNFGATQRILISGTVFNDLDGDRVQDSGEGGLSSWRVFIDADADGVWDSTEKSVLTGSSGTYSFKDLAAGTYRVRVVQQSGWSRTTPTSGYHSVTLSSGGSATGRLFGERRIA